VDASTGFQHLGTIDHAPLYADNGAGVSCGKCDAMGCYDYVCGGYAPEVRRGHFVQGDGATYVYSFSYAGVLVNDLQNLTQPVARVGLPTPTFDNYTPWYGSDGNPMPSQDGGVGVAVGRPLPDAQKPPEVIVGPVAVDAGPAVVTDAGPVVVTDAGVARPESDAGSAILPVP
jgi:hypothetical protein